MVARRGRIRRDGPSRPTEGSPVPIAAGVELEAGHGLGKGAACERGGHSRGGGQVLGAAGGEPRSCPPLGSSLARSLTSSAPAPGGPPNLWPEMAMKSASGRGILPAACAQSHKSKAPERFTIWQTRSMGWIPHAGLIVHELDCDQRRLGGEHARSSAERSTSPPLSTGSIFAPSPIAAITASCSVGADDPPLHPGAGGDDLDRLACTRGEDDVMPPAERVGDSPCADSSSAALERRPSAWRRAGIGPGLQRTSHRLACFPAAPASSQPHGRGIKAAGHGSKAKGVLPIAC